MNATAKQPISMNISALPGATTREMLADQPMRMTISKLNFWYGPKQTLFDVTLGFAANHIDRKSTRLNSSHGYISYAVFCLKKKKKNKQNSCVIAQAIAGSM